MRTVSVLAVFFLLVAFNCPLARASFDVPTPELSKEHEQIPSSLLHETRNTFLFPLVERPQQPDVTSLPEDPYVELSGDPPSKAAQKNLEQRLDRIEQKLDGPTSTETRINDAMRRIDEQANRHVSFLNAGFTALGVLAAILALAGIGITFFTSKIAIQSIRGYRRELESIVKQARQHELTLRDMLSSHSPSEKFSTQIVAKAKEAIKNGIGTDVLWGNAVLAQEQNHWQEALTYWQGVLETFPQDVNALFGASLASLELAEKATGEEQQRYFHLGEGYFQKFSQDQLNSSVLYNWGNLCMARGEAAASQEEREKWFAQAGEKYARAIREKPGDATSWCNWGTLCMERGNAAANREEREEWFAQAGEKYARVARENPGHAVSWFNWACLESLRDNPNQCVAYLEKWHELSSDSSISDLDSEKYFDAVRSSPEFIAFREKVQKERGK